MKQTGSVFAAHAHSAYCKLSLSRFEIYNKCFVIYLSFLCLHFYVVRQTIREEQIST